jgi:hypothetical protein
LTRQPRCPTIVVAGGTLSSCRRSCAACSSDGSATYLEDNEVGAAFLPTQFGEQSAHDRGGVAAHRHVAGEKLRAYRLTIVNVTGRPSGHCVHVAFVVAHGQHPTASRGTRRCWILDRKNRLCPVGIAGESVAGAGIARGYWNKPGSPPKVRRASVPRGRAHVSHS